MFWTYTFWFSGPDVSPSQNIYVSSSSLYVLYIPPLPDCLLMYSSSCLAHYDKLFLFFNSAPAVQGAGVRGAAEGGAERCGDGVPRDQSHWAPHPQPQVVQGRRGDPSWRRAGPDAGPEGPDFGDLHLRGHQLYGLRSLHLQGPRRLLRANQTRPRVSQREEKFSPLLA